VSAVSPGRPRRWLRLSGLSAAVVLASGAGGGLWLRPAVCFLARGTDTRLGFCAEAPTRRSEHVLSEAGLTVEVYQPPQPATATLVLVPGLHPQGIRDPRFRSFADACAQAGFAVVAPDVVEFRTFHIQADVVDRLARLVEALPRHLPAATLRNVGLFGVSYAGGPVLVAAARPEVAARLHFVGAFGGYYDLVHAVDYGLTGTHPGTSGLPAPHQWARMILVAQDAAGFLPQPDAREVEQALRLRLDLKVPEAEAREAAMSPAARTFLNDVLDGPSPAETARFQAALPRYQPLSRRLSPSAVVPALDPRLRVYLLHGRGDDVIPYCETEELERAFARAGHPHVNALISAAFRHVDPTTEGGGLSMWKERLRLMVWTRGFIAEARR
jgi:pimeloyl-ACP methyl ester carboxylesterase